MHCITAYITFYTVFLKGPVGRRDDYVLVNRKCYRSQSVSLMENTMRWFPCASALLRIL